MTRGPAGADADPGRPRTAEGGGTTRERPGEAELLFALVEARYGARLEAAQLDDLRRTVAAIVAGVETIRRVPLRNADGPPPLAVPPG